MAVDLRAVAERSGVSVSTASRALRGSERVSALTTARVRAVADDLGYRPNAHARALRTSRSQFVGLVVTNLFNSSFQTIAEVVQRAVAARGYVLVLAVTGGEDESERSALQALSDHNAAGVIVVGSDTEAPDQLRSLGIPVVHLARRPKAPAGDSVLGEEVTGARAATEYLIGLQHRRIAVIAAPRRVSSGRERLRGHRLALQAAGLPVPEELVLSVAQRPDAGADAVARLLALPARRRPTALLVANHEASLGVLPALQQHGCDIPADLSVICYEDSQLARCWHPAVTVVENNAAQMGEAAARLLLERIVGPRQHTDGFQELRIGGRLVERSSCAAARR